MSENLTAKVQRFVEEYVIDLNGKQAAIRAGYSAKTAESQASRLLRNDKVFAAVAEAQKRISERTEITQDRVLKRWWAIATADVNEVIQYRRVCCRHCHGEGHAYQWKDAEEYQRALAAAAAREDATPEAMPTYDGGYGFNPTFDPHLDCPQCFGEGHGEVFAADTRKLSGNARLLYDGVKITDRGMEIKTLDRAKALDNVARHLGMFVDKTEITGKDGGPIKVEEIDNGIIARTLALMAKASDE